MLLLLLLLWFSFHDRFHLLYTHSSSFTINRSDKSFWIFKMKICVSRKYAFVHNFFSSFFYIQFCFLRWIDGIQYCFDTKTARINSINLYSIWCIRISFVFINFVEFAICIDAWQRRSIKRWMWMWIYNKWMIMSTQGAIIRWIHICHEMSGHAMINALWAQPTYRLWNIILLR